MDSKEVFEMPEKFSKSLQEGSWQFLKNRGDSQMPDFISVKSTENVPVLSSETLKQPISSYKTPTTIVEGLCHSLVGVKIESKQSVGDMGSKEKLIESWETEEWLEDMALQGRMQHCRCSNLNENKEEEDKVSEGLLSEFRASVKSNNLKGRPKIREVTRSPQERKNRAARQEFIKELAQMEVAAIEKRQKYKPRGIKSALKKEAVYETIKAMSQISDSQSALERGFPSVPSTSTLYGTMYNDAHPHSSKTSTGSNSSDSVESFKFQLKKDHSLGSKATDVLTREDAFVEIELSEDEEFKEEPGPAFVHSSTSSEEVLSSSSDISLRVNLDKPLKPQGQTRLDARKAPYFKYKNKVDAEASAPSRDKEITNQEAVIIEKIATEFGEWAKDNGLKPEAVEKDMIKELFQFGIMDSAANSIAVEIKELIIVPECVTNGFNPELEERAALYRQILFDEVAYWKTERSLAFGKPDPRPYKRPAHQPLPLWTKSGFVPQPLSTGELLYQSLIDNNSLMLEQFVLWTIENPNQHRPPYLVESGYFQKVIDKYGGSEDEIRKRDFAAKNLVQNTGKNLARLNIGMKKELRKLKEMSVSDGKGPKLEF